MVRENELKNGWNEKLQTFTQTYGNEALGSSLQLMETYGFIGANDMGYQKTVRAVIKALLHNVLMYRY